MPKLAVLLIFGMSVLELLVLIKPENGSETQLVELKEKIKMMVLILSPLMLVIKISTTMSKSKDGGEMIILQLIMSLLNSKEVLKSLITMLIKLLLKKQFQINKLNFIW